MTGPRLSRIEGWELHYELDPPLALGARRIDARRYCLLRLTGDDGTDGVAYTLTRDAPVLEALETLARARLVGCELDDLAAEVRAAVVDAREHASIRAASLADICWWDMRAKHLGQPVWQALGVRAGPRRS